MQIHNNQQVYSCLIKRKIIKGGNMKSEKIRLYAIELSLVIFLLLANIFNNIFTRQITAIILLVFMVVSIKLIKNDK